MANVSLNSPLVSQAYSGEPIRQIFNNLNAKLPDQLPKYLKAETDDHTASFEIHFFENRMVTHFKNERKAIELSTFLSTLQGADCTHIFNPEYAKAICPKMRYPSNVDGLVKGIRSIYIGRCIFGLSKSIKERGHDYSTHLPEFERIAKLIKRIEPGVYSSPII